MIRSLIFLTLSLSQVNSRHLISPRITNGEDAFRSQFPFMASIQYSNSQRLPYVHICCGVVIDEYWILSTAVCIEATMRSGRFRVKVGANYTETADNTVQMIKIAERFVRRDFERRARPNNIGLIKLKDRINNAVVIKLAQPGPSPTGEAFIVGWGKTSPNLFESFPRLLQFADVLLIDNEHCKSLFLEARQSVFLYSSQMCSYQPGNAVTPCVGDSGGALVRYVHRKPEVVGLISWTLQPCGQIDVPTVSTRVSHFTNWINKTMTMTADRLFVNDHSTVSLLHAT